MASEEQLAILRQGAEVWNKYRAEYPRYGIYLEGADLRKANLGPPLIAAGMDASDVANARYHAEFRGVDLRGADLRDANLSEANLFGVDFNWAVVKGSNFSKASVGLTYFGNLDLRDSIGLDKVNHHFPSTISIETFALSYGNIPEIFLRGCGLSDWEIEQVKLYNPKLRNYEITQIQYKIYELRATQALQISPLFISYSHADSRFVDKLGDCLTEKGIRYWRDTHEMKAGRIETQIDRGIRQNPTVLLVLSKQSLASDWVEHEVRAARLLEKEMGRDVLCPVALDDSWKDSRWPKRIMEQIMEYNILDFSAWKDDNKFDGMFRKLIDGLELFYKR